MTKCGYRNACLWKFLPFLLTVCAAWLEVSGMFCSAVFMRNMIPYDNCAALWNSRDIFLVVCILSFMCSEHISRCGFLPWSLGCGPLLLLGGEYDLVEAVASKKNLLCSARTTVGKCALGELCLDRWIGNRKVLGGWEYVASLLHHHQELIAACWFHVRCPILGCDLLSGVRPVSKQEGKTENSCVEISWLIWEHSWGIHSSASL